ncbi:MAG: hypothetical protein HRU13_09930, partial [Phycisphaerales bacterium]|nr:hypothetical protein [Phycisphaerales bacterium]
MMLMGDFGNAFLLLGTRKDPAVALRCLLKGMYRHISGPSPLSALGSEQLISDALEAVGDPISAEDAAAILAKRGGLHSYRAKLRAEVRNFGMPWTNTYPRVKLLLRNKSKYNVNRRRFHAWHTLFFNRWQHEPWLRDSVILPSPAELERLRDTVFCGPRTDDDPKGSYPRPYKKGAGHCQRLITRNADEDRKVWEGPGNTDDDPKAVSHRRRSPKSTKSASASKKPASAPTSLAQVTKERADKRQARTASHERDRDSSPPPKRARREGSEDAATADASGSNATFNAAMHASLESSMASATPAVRTNVPDPPEPARPPPPGGADLDAPAPTPAAPLSAQVAQRVRDLQQMYLNYNWRPKGFAEASTALSAIHGEMTARLDGGSGVVPDVPVQGLLHMWELRLGQLFRDSCERAEPNDDEHSSHVARLWRDYIHLGSVGIRDAHFLRTRVRLGRSAARVQAAAMLLAAAPGHYHRVTFGPPIQETINLALREQSRAIDLGNELKRAQGKPTLVPKYRLNDCQGLLERAQYVLRHEAILRTIPGAPSSALWDKLKSSFSTLNWMHQRLTAEPDREGNDSLDVFAKRQSDFSKLLLPLEQFQRSSKSSRSPPMPGANAPPPIAPRAAEGAHCETAPAHPAPVPAQRVVPSPAASSASSPSGVRPSAVSSNLPHPVPLAPPARVDLTSPDSAASLLGARSSNDDGADSPSPDDEPVHHPTATLKLYWRAHEHFSVPKIVNWLTNSSARCLLPQITDPIQRSHMFTLFLGVVRCALDFLQNLVNYYFSTPREEAARNQHSWLEPRNGMLALLLAFRVPFKVQWFRTLCCCLASGGFSPATILREGARWDSLLAHYKTLLCNELLRQGAICPQGCLLKLYHDEGAPVAAHLQMPDNDAAPALAVLSWWCCLNHRQVFVDGAWRHVAFSPRWDNARFARAERRHGSMRALFVSRYRASLKRNRRPKHTVPPAQCAEIPDMFSADAGPLQPEPALSVTSGVSGMSGASSARHGLSSRLADEILFPGASLPPGPSPRKKAHAPPADRRPAVPAAAASPSMPVAGN